MAYSLASHCTLDKIEGIELHLLLDPLQAPMLNHRLQNRLQDHLSHILVAPIKLNIKCIKAKEKSPAEQTHIQQKEKHQKAEKTLENDPNVKAIMNQFNAKLKKDTIIPTS